MGRTLPWNDPNRRFGPLEHPLSVHITQIPEAQSPGVAYAFLGDLATVMDTCRFREPGRYAVLPWWMVQDIQTDPRLVLPPRDRESFGTAWGIDLYWFEDTTGRPVTWVFYGERDRNFG